MARSKFSTLEAHADRGRNRGFVKHRGRQGFCKAPREEEGLYKAPRGEEFFGKAPREDGLSESTEAGRGATTCWRARSRFSTLEADACATVSAFGFRVLGSGFGA